jgi:hypothetical protein
MIINYPLYSSEAFKWNGNKGSTDASALATTPREVVPVPIEQRIGEGIFVVSTATGQRRFFTPVHDEDGYDGEFQLFENDGIFVQIWNY